MPESKIFVLKNTCCGLYWMIKYQFSKHAKAQRFDELYLEKNVVGWIFLYSKLYI